MGPGYIVTSDDLSDRLITNNSELKWVFKSVLIEFVQ